MSRWLLLSLLSASITCCTSGQVTPGSTTKTDPKLSPGQHKCGKQAQVLTLDITSFFFLFFLMSCDVQRVENLCSFNHQPRATPPSGGVEWCKILPQIYFSSDCAPLYIESRLFFRPTCQNAHQYINAIIRLNKIRCCDGVYEYRKAC